MMNHLMLAGTAMIFAISVMGGDAVAKQQSRAITAEMRANALANVERYDWAAEQQSSAIRAARAWVAMDDDELWELITSQELPRDIHTNKELGCPNCGDGIVPYGNYPWTTAGDASKANLRSASIHVEGLIPWKLRCPNCEEVYPKNDFWSYYQSALDEHGFFRRELGDESLLYNEEHPDPDDPLHKLYVDDGYGLTDSDGNRHRFIAYYNSWMQWTNIRRGLDALAHAYSLTSDPVYAHKAAVLIDRIADVYPDMDFEPFHRMGFEHSHWGTGMGRIIGCSWEGGAVQRMAENYDIIFDGMQGNEELVAFISRKAEEHNLGDKSSLEAITGHIAENMLMEFVRGLEDLRIRGRARKALMIVIATALDTPGVSEELIDRIFEPGFPSEADPDGRSLNWLLVECIGRDGIGRECGGYGLSWMRSARQYPALLEKYPEYTRRDLIAEFPKLRQTFLVEPRLMALDAVLPPYGDSGSTGGWGRIGAAATFVEGYRLYRDQRMADLAWRYADGDPARLRPSNAIFLEDPDALPREIAAVAGDEDFRLRCDHLGRYGQLVLQTEEPDAARGRAIWLAFGWALGHRHADALNLGLYAHNIDMLPDLGYPEYTGAWPKRHAWTANTISHNTLVINDVRNRANSGGQISLFACEPPVRVTEVMAPDAYDDIDAYRRTVALVDISDDDSYVLDVFRARGGTNHRLSYHGPAGAATVERLEMIEQPTGTFAGPDVEFAELPGEGETIRNTSGFSYLYDVERSGGPVESYYTVDWQAEDRRGRIAEGRQPHLRLHALTPVDEVALASGDPPQNRAGNPRSLRYLIQSRIGEEMQSQFVTMLEPYDTTPFISEVRLLETEHAAAAETVVAVAVEMIDGTVDILISCEERTRVEVEGGIEFDGRFGMVRIENGDVRLMRMSDASLLRVGDVALEAEQPAWEGVVTAINADDPADHRISLDPPLPPDADVVGRRIHFHNDVPKDTTWVIEAITETGISTGEITIIWDFLDSSDYAAGFRYLVNEDDRFVIPNHFGLDR